jgi:hypothetical protein
LRKIVFLQKFNISSYRYVSSVDGQWGSLVDPGTQAWNGMIGMVQRKENVELIIQIYN